MPIYNVATSITPLEVIDLEGKTEIAMTVRNRGSVALNVFELQFQTSPNSPWKRWLHTSNDWTNPTAHSFLVGSTGLDPTSLDAGEEVQFKLDQLGPFFKSRTVASVASGSTLLEIEVGTY